ncbi:NAD(P)/FAD-dependent oxidoreductase [Pararobbsia silviterrae]|uniref:NAD(P)/FAD-dependent oxidoreductase n=1 Tax=Pararobbsia silviterrae TaxID=1792498 RepID=A0A494XUK9_9BURK|nr:FAD-dependent oxidoreductase [Pararobbsia silviterrae]RKP53534.1 NAD(P)/FAD-dependent oxidoreductase [Pararobbsia silviterrae]
MTNGDIVIVGGGHAGAQCAAALRQYGYTGAMAILTDERDAPYERPPLSKDFLNGVKTFDQMLLQPLAFWADKQIDVHYGQRVESVDAARHEITCANGECHGYRKLIWATGGRARRLHCEGSTLEGLHVVRTRADVDGIRAELGNVEHVVVIGGGFIGLEAAASLRKLGKRVTIVEALDRVLARVTGQALSSFIEDAHRAQGTQIVLSAKVASLAGERGRVREVVLHDGARLRADLVIVGVGIEPAIEPLRAAGAHAENGLVVDASCRTTLDDIYAIGDCARQSHAFAGGAAIRLESVQNAVEQAALVASHITGRAPAKPSVPWFWSTQHDLRIQMAGLSAGHDDFVIRGSREAKAFSIAYLKDGVFVALDAVNATKDFVQAKAIIAKGIRPERAALADPGVPLNSFV